MNNLDRISRNAERLHRTIFCHALKGLSIGLISLGMIGGASYACHNFNAHAQIINYIPRNKWISELGYSDFGLNNNNDPSDSYFMKYRNFNHLPKNLYSLGKNDGRDYKEYHHALNSNTKSDYVSVGLNDSMPNLNHKDSNHFYPNFYPSDFIISTMVKSKLNRSYIKGLMNNKYNRSDKKGINNLFNKAGQLIHKHHINKRANNKSRVNRKRVRKLTRSKLSYRGMYKLGKDQSERYFDSYGGASTSSKIRDGNYLRTNKSYRNGWRHSKDYIQTSGDDKIETKSLMIFSKYYKRSKEFRKGYQAALSSLGGDNSQMASNNKMYKLGEKALQMSI